MVIRNRLLVVAAAAALMTLSWALFGPARRAEAGPAGGFVAPLPAPLIVLQAFDPPTQPWLPGNRGVDLAATTGEPVVAASDGVVLYAGLLAGRGVVSISHGDVRTTYEPVDPAVARGASVRRGEVVGHVSAVADGCGPPGGCLHWGAIRSGAYIDPVGLLAVPRVRLLPIWANGLPATASGSLRGGRAAVVPVHQAKPSGGAPGRAGSSVADVAAVTAAGLGVGAAVVALGRTVIAKTIRS